MKIKCIQNGLNIAIINSDRPKDTFFGRSYFVEMSCANVVQNSQQKIAAVLTDDCDFQCTQGRDRTGTSVTPLVFETSASTNSATWAWCQISGTKILFFLYVQIKKNQ